MVELVIAAFSSFLLYLILIDKLAAKERTQEERRALETEMDEAEARRQERRKRLAFDRPSPCQDCTEYHGLIYGGVRLVCAMHPYGVDGENCPDWQ
jgi:hypothetical protein